MKSLPKLFRARTLPAVCLCTAGLGLATLVGPLSAQTVQVQLGEFGGTVDLSVNDDGQTTWNGMPVFEGSIVTGTGGRRYVLSVEAGRWSASYYSDLVRVPLGNSGQAVTLERLENGEYWWGSRVQSGLSVRAADGMVYRLVLLGGSWEAEPVQSSISIALGDSDETVSLALLPNGSYSIDGQPVSVGLLITGKDGTRYELALSDGKWVARPYVAPDPEISGPSLPTLPVIESDTLSSHVGVTPALTLSADGVRNAVLRVGGTGYALTDLSQRQLITETDTFSSRAANQISVLRRQIDLFEIIHEDNPGSLTEALQEVWNQARSSVEGLFGADGAAEVFDLTVPQDSRQRVDVDEVEETIDAVVTALQSAVAFQAALTDGLLEGALEVEQAEEAFNAPAEWSAMQFGATPNTRFGAYLRYHRLEGAGWQDDMILRSDDEGFGSFAYSPLAESIRATLPRQGSASYSGRTVAVSPSGDFGVYAGTIDFSVRFSTSTVNGTIRGLANDTGELLLRSGRPVSEIALPQSSIELDGSFSASGGTGLLLYDSAAAESLTQSVTMDLSGQMVGRGSESGTAMMGTWSIISTVGGAPTLVGAFGAELHRLGAEPAP